MSREDDVKRLTLRLEESRPTLEKFDLYYGGMQPLSFLAPEVREAVGTRLKSLVVNWPRLVVGAVEERLDVEGFRQAPEADPDSELWAIWQANNLDEGSQQAHTEALVHGRSYVIVWGTEDGAPLITVESPLQVYVEHDPATRQRVRALKRWAGDDGYAHATLYEPDAITRWRSKGRTPEGVDAAYATGAGWVEVERLDNPLGVVPVVPLVNRPRVMNPDGESELADVLPLADAVNKLATDLMVSAEYHAMPRRFATGIEIAEEPVLDANGAPVLDANGLPVTQPSTQFAPVAGRTWIAESEEAKFGQFPEAQLTGFTDAIKTLTHALASLSALPPHYIALSAVDAPASAESIRSAEASLVSKARRKQRAFGGSWEEVMRLAVLVRDGVLPARADRMETVWRDPETRTVAQAADAALKLVQGGILPAQAAMEDYLGMSPQQVERVRTMRRQEALDRAVADLERVVAG